MNREGKPPASKTFIRNLPTTTIKPGTECPICTDEFDPRESATVLPCRHLFHRACITPWLEVVRGTISISLLSVSCLFSNLLGFCSTSQNNSCPLCRDELPTDDEEYEREKREKKKAEAKKNRKEEDGDDYNPLYG